MYRYRLTDVTSVKMGSVKYRFNQFSLSGRLAFFRSAIVTGLERVAEELMGRRKWKLYQEVLARSHLNAAAVTTVTNNTSAETVINSNDDANTEDERIETSGEISSNSTQNCTSTAHQQSDREQTASLVLQLASESETSQATAIDDCISNAALHHRGAAMPGANCSNGSSTPTTSPTITTTTAATNNNNNRHHQHIVQPPAIAVDPLPSHSSLPPSATTASPSRRRSFSPNAGRTAAGYDNELVLEVNDADGSRRTTQIGATTFGDRINKYPVNSLTTQVSTESTGTTTNQETASTPTTPTTQSTSLKATTADAIKRELADSDSGRICVNNTDGGETNNIDGEKITKIAEVEKGEKTTFLI